MFVARRGQEEKRHGSRAFKGLGGRGFEAHGDTVHTITKARRFGAFIENMAEMTTAALAMDRGPRHAEEGIWGRVEGFVQRCQKLGQPVPLSNLVVEENRSRSQPAQVKMPRRPSCNNGLVKGLSVPLCRSTAY